MNWITGLRQSSCGRLPQRAAVLLTATVCGVFGFSGLPIDYQSNGATRAATQSHSRAQRAAAQLTHIDGGTFLMGSPVNDPRNRNYRRCEHPQVPVSVADFRLSRFLVTAEEYCEFLNEVGNAGYFIEDTGWIDWKTLHRVEQRFIPKPGAERCPAYPVTWYGAMVFCRWLSQESEISFRLPTEAEWEYAARGAELRAWPWGNDPPLYIAHAAHGSFHRELRRLASAPDPLIRLATPIDAHVPLYQLFGERWISWEFDFDRPNIKTGIATFSRNATPQGVYDMMGYGPGQWCQDTFRGTDELGVLRGVAEVPVDRETFYRTTSFLELLLAGDGGSPEVNPIPGRTWSRVGMDRRRGAIFRVAAAHVASR